jgi:hypothetical protein
MLMTSILVMLHSSLPSGTDSLSTAKTFYGLDLSQVFLPVSRFFEKLNSLSPAVAIGVLAILALWFFDQLFVKTVKR